MKLLQTIPKPRPEYVGKTIKVVKFAYLPTMLTDGSIVWLEDVLYTLSGYYTTYNGGMCKAYHWNIIKDRVENGTTNTTPSIPGENEIST